MYSVSNQVIANLFIYLIANLSAHTELAIARPKSCKVKSGHNSGGSIIIPVAAVWILSPKLVLTLVDLLFIHSRSRRRRGGYDEEKFVGGLE